MFWWIIKVLVWAAAGYLASRLMKATMPLWMNIVLGLLGGFAGSLIGGIIGIGSTNVIGSILISTAGACLVIYLARTFLPRIMK